MGEAPATRWKWLGRLLPAEVRERVFEPAFADLLRAWLTEEEGARRLPFGVRALGTLAGCAPIALPSLFVRRGRLTRLGKAAVWVAAIFTTLVFLLLNVVQPYADYGN